MFGVALVCQRGCWVGLFPYSRDVPDACFYAGHQERGRIVMTCLLCEPYRGCWHGHTQLPAVVASVAGLFHCVCGGVTCGP
jgi:hypothetical protein